MVIVQNVEHIGIRLLIYCSVLPCRMALAIEIAPKLSLTQYDCI